MGHNLGMRHDFDPNPGDDRFCTTDGSSCTDDGGVMDYFQVSLFKIFFFSECAFFNIQPLHYANFGYLKKLQYAMFLQVGLYSTNLNKPIYP